MTTAKTHTPSTLADDLGTTAKTVRKFLRSEQGLDSKVGKGKRWAISSKDATSLKRRFPKWQAEQEAERKERQAKRDAEAEVNTEEVTEVEDEVQDPTDEEIQELELEN